MTARSNLFVPGDRPERFARARDSGADAVIVDLEDAVAPDRKPSARDALHDSLDAARPVIVRVNGVDTTWFDDDARLAAHPGIAAVMLPKADGPDGVAALRQRAGDKPVLALVETARGMTRLAALAATVAGLPGPVDGVTTVLDNPARIAADAQRARSLGFGARLCIHPAQVAAVNAAFGPSAEQLSWARRVVEAASHARGAAIAVDGKMVDAPVLARALRLLAQLEETT